MFLPQATVCISKLNFHSATVSEFVRGVFSGDRIAPEAKLNFLGPAVCDYLPLSAALNSGYACLKSSMRDHSQAHQVVPVPKGIGARIHVQMPRRRARGVIPGP